LLDGSLGGELDSTFIIPVSSNVYTAIKSVLSLAGDNIEPNLDSSFSTETTPYTITKEVGDGTLGDILIELAEMLSANIFYDENGRLTFEPDFNDNIKSSEWDFSTTQFNYLGGSNSYKYSKLYNSILIIGDNINGEVFDWTETNTNLLSPTSVNSLGYIRTKIIKDEFIYSDALAELRAKFELKREIAVQLESDITCIPMYHLDVDKIITLTNPDLGLISERFLINSISIPFKIGGEMSIQAVKATDLPYSS
jgi:hypothetical protein